MDSNTLVFVVGLGRSGTSLLRSILNRHTDVALTPELHYFDKYVAEFGRRSLGTADDRSRFIDSFVRSPHFQRMEIPSDPVMEDLKVLDNPTFQDIYTAISSHYARYHTAHVRGEKCPPYYNYLSQLLDWYPTARILFLIRDPRAVAASFAYIDAAWGTSNVLDISKRWLRAEAELSRWSECESVLPVRYEDLVRAPEHTMRTICDHLTIPFEPDMLSIEQQAAERSSHGSLRTDAPVSTSNIDIWKERLSVDEIALVECATGDRMREQGYDHNFDGLSSVQQRLATRMRRQRSLVRLRSVITHPVTYARRRRYAGKPSSP